jgi:hypothetical protein
LQGRWASKVVQDLIVSGSTQFVGGSFMGIKGFSFSSTVSPTTQHMVAPIGHVNIRASDALGTGDVTIGAKGGQIKLGNTTNEYFTFNVDASPELDVTGDFIIDATGDITLDATGNAIIDASGDITLDAAGAQIYFKDNATTRFTFQLDSTPEIDVVGAFKLDCSSTLEIECAGILTIDPAGNAVTINGGNSGYGGLSLKGKGDTIADGLAVYGDASTSSTRLWTDASGLRHISGGSGDTGTIYVNDSGGDLVVGDDIYIKGTSSSNQTDLRINTTSGLVYHYASTRKVKNNIANIDVGLSEIIQLQPTRYERKSDPGVPEIGLIAEDVQSALGDDYVILGPDFAYDENGDYTWREIPAETEGNPPKREKILDSDETVPHDWDYRAVVTALVGAVKDMKAENDSLAARIAALENS